MAVPVIPKPFRLETLKAAVVQVRNFWVPPGLSVAGLTPGAMVTVQGHQDALSTRWVVTTLALETA